MTRPALRSAPPPVERRPDGSPLRVLLCHNYYQQAGGEDESFADEARMLEVRGHRVAIYTRDNASIETGGRLRVAAETIWSRRTLRDVRELIARERPDVLHCTNTFPLISPSVYTAAREAGVAVVQALRNYRLMCPKALLYREGAICESCVGRTVAWPAVLHGCYRGSRAASAVVAGMLATHRARGTWDRDVDLYYAPSEFTRSKFVEGGWPAERTRVKPNFVDPDPGPGEGDGGYVLFVGRHAPEKGLQTLVEAWRHIPEPIPLKVIGDGPLADLLVAAARRDQRIEWLGRRRSAEVLESMGHAGLVVQPSEWYETFGRTIVEAFARGTPVVVGGIGAMAELVDHGRTGLHFQPRDPADLAARIRQLMLDPDRRRAMRVEARREYLARYTADPNYRALIEIYGEAIALARAAAGR